MNPQALLLNIMYLASLVSQELTKDPVIRATNNGSIKRYIIDHMSYIIVDNISFGFGLTDKATKIKF